MSRTIQHKELINTRLATNYGGWMYCDQCGENIGYLCYSTYDKIELQYRCNCGCRGEVMIDFEDSSPGEESDEELVPIKNRLCCPADHEPLITLLEKKLLDYDLKITCKKCAKIYKRFHSN